LSVFIHQHFPPLKDNVGADFHVDAADSKSATGLGLVRPWTRAQQLPLGVAVEQQ
jgi:hypothetical protein